MLGWIRPCVREGEDLQRVAAGVGRDKGRAHGDAAPALAHGAGAEDAPRQQAEEDLGEHVVIDEVKRRCHRVCV